MRIRVGHLYPDYLNIYADRGNIAVFQARSRARGLDLDVTPIGLGDTVEPGAHDLYYVGGGQDKEQALIAKDIATKSEALQRGRGRRRRDARRLRRLPAARPAVSRPLRRRPARAPASCHSRRSPASGG